MFPDLDGLMINLPCEGEAFRVAVRSHGIGVSSREVAVKPEGWAKCRVCEHDRRCYELGMAKLALDTAACGRA